MVVLQENRIALQMDISGMWDSRIADEIAIPIGIHTDSDYRIKKRNAIYSPSRLRRRPCLSSKGRALFSSAAGLLGVDSSYMEKHLVDLAIGRKDRSRRKRRSDTDLSGSILLSGVK